MLMVSQLENRRALDASPIARSTWRIWLAFNHPLTAQNSISMSDLIDEPFITTRLDEIEDSTQPFWRAANIQPRSVITTGSIEAVRSLVACGVGITILPDVFYRPCSLDGERIAWRPTMENIPPLSIGMAWRGGLALNAQTQNFLDIAREYVRMR